MLATRSRLVPVLFAVAALLAGGPALAQEGPFDLANLAACYTEGVDAIGAGRTEAGRAIWSGCFADDFSFSMSFGAAFSMSCPGEKCQFPASMSPLDRRVALARGTYDRGGYIATSHHITTLGIQRLAADSARVKGHLQAWHVRKDGATVLGLGTWEVQARLTPAGWRIVDEKLESPIRVVIPKAE
jgi:SnoaL-like domain